MAAFSAKADLDFNKKAAKKAPTLPPAPTIPETDPMVLFVYKWHD
ncbi:hypothetical protein [Thalassobellus suaedae]|uniref:Uncharacterized protein n=1 Tax=Thalassobellus suaedae TaxID=3074124 RepID=A0ABY9XYD3_9FLAO|nr:hypothetical protein RHP51_09345 [Flavobacteriaceae bacterium HL-DH14]